MLWLIGIASVWIFTAVMAVALCVVARRGDESLLLAADFGPVVAELPADVPWVATIAEPMAPAPARVRHTTRERI